MSSKIEFDCKVFEPTIKNKMKTFQLIHHTQLQVPLKCQQLGLVINAIEDECPTHRNKLFCNELWQTQ